LKANEKDFSDSVFKRGNGMSVNTNEQSKSITLLLNGTITSLRDVVPLEPKINKPGLLQGNLNLQFGVLIGIIGDIKGQLLITGDSNIFGSIGETMFGMPLDGEMLVSFSGELGNMIAGGIATNIVKSGVRIDITTPTILKGDTTLSGYKKAIHINVFYLSLGDLNIYLLLEQ
jgi:chemotaxis protein CheX